MSKWLVENNLDEQPLHDNECLSCGDTPLNECPKSKRKCGHHCNHSWTHDECCWCGKHFGEEASDG